ncbi:MAG TPA: amidohydrolase/deacetylase family metallohydrolase [Spirochaetia bacterium]|nr:amidohydrolase/deacetylase family metallohydrolase [Spirochaetia bacterium]
MYDALLKNGRVIDPSSATDGLLDIAITKGRIAKLDRDIAPAEAVQTFDLSGKIVTPGLIDAHCHPVKGFSDHFVRPDDVGVDSGVLLVNDAGTAGAANFSTLRELFVGKTATEMSFFLNFATCGLIREPEIQTATDTDTALLKEAVEANRPLIRGIKIRALEALVGAGDDLFGSALDAARELGMPLMVHIGTFRPRREDDPFDDITRSLVKRLRPGDILSHFMTPRPGGMVTPDGRIYPELESARERGVFLDSCHGKFNFSFPVAQRLLEAGLHPDIISTDMSVMGFPYVQSLLVTMSKFINLGMSLYNVVDATTTRPAVALGVAGEWGSLQVGRRANISVIELVDGSFTFFDGNAGNKLTGGKLLEPRMVIKEGSVYPCRSFYHLPAEAADARPFHPGFADQGARS